jgi:pimeloyl-ACP methyl ester carboxylesterase
MEDVKKVVGFSQKIVIVSRYLQQQLYFRLKCYRGHHDHMQERMYNIKRWSKMSKGGHFAALEQPKLLINDIRAFARTLR